MTQATAGASEKTAVGSYFVSNYPPYSFWTPGHVGQAVAALDRPPMDKVPLGLYFHIPFCRKRCRFCYFKVYTDKDSAEINRYIDGLIDELTLYARKAAAAGRKPKFVYFGGGTPSYISTQQLRRLVDGIRPLFPWDEAEEITFECEPGTVSKSKLEILREIGVTRLSLGVENFADAILELNGRAHNAADIDKVYQLARDVGFPQINIDLIAGMVGETDENWRACVSKTIALDPDSVTVYQMELPPNTVISKEMRAHGQESAPVADWPVKRAWAKYAFSEFEKAGYTLTSGYTAVKDPKIATFLYRDLLWTGADLLALGVASFSHLQGVHFQNQSRIEEYEAALENGELPIYRALKTTEEERMIREFILQMKKGRVNTRYFENKYGVALQERFACQFEELAGDGFLTTDADNVRLTRDGLLRVDELLHRFFLPEHRVANAA